MPTLGSDHRVWVEVHTGAAPCVFNSTNVSRGYFPSRGLHYSLLLHGIFIAGMIFLPAARRHLAAQAQTPEQAPMVEDTAIDPKNVMFLPLLNGGGQEGLSGGDSAPGSMGPAASAEPGVKGLSYPGPQPIFSNPPKPTNRIQTVLQPAIENPPTLPPPIPMPNIVQIADAGPAPRLELPEPVRKLPDAVEPQTRVTSDIQPEVKEPEPVPPAVAPMPQTPPEATMVIPSSDALNGREEEMGPPVPPPQEAPPQRAATPPASHDVKARTPQPRPKPPEQPKKQPPLEAPKESLVAETAAARTRGSDRRSLLALTPMSAPREQPFELPPGEARGRFAISPNPNLDTSEIEPGSKIGTASTGAGIGNQPAASAGNVTDANAAAAGKGGTGSGSGTAKTGSGSGSESATGSHSGSGSGNGTGSGQGNGTGSGLNGTGSGQGNGAGSGPGPIKRPFSGITILGGAPGPGGVSTNSASPPQTPRPLQKAYGVTILSTEASGGGLPFFGVFSSSRIYTVFLDMRKTEADKAPSWPLEYAVPQGITGQAGSDENQSQGLVLPYPAVKEQPVLPAELVRQHLGRMVVVFATITADGKMEQITIKESPDARLDKPVLDTLGKWLFRPAELNGENVPVEILMGIPLWVAQ